MNATRKHKGPEGQSGYGTVVKSTGLLGGVQVVTMLIALARNKVAAMLLGPAGLALVNIYITATTLLSSATNCGLPSSAVKHVAEASAAAAPARLTRLAQTVRAWCLLAGAAGTVLACALSPLLSHWMFADDAHAWALCALSPMVGMSAVIGGELAILKGLRRLRRVAAASLWSALATLAACVVGYSLAGIAAVVPVLLAGQALMLGVHLRLSTACCPWRWPRWRPALRRGLPMVRLGTAFVAAAVVTQAMEFAIRALMLRSGTLDDVGLYNSGYAIAVTYASVVFAAIEADYFPRLSAVGADREAMNRTINVQVRACVLLIAPVLLLFVLAMPLIIRLLYSSAFVGATATALAATPYMFCKAMSLPVAYLPLARGDGRTFCAAEAGYAVVATAAIPLGFAHGGLAGAGWALSAVGLAELLLLYAFYCRRYGFRFALAGLPFCAAQGLLLACGLAAALVPGLPLWARWATGGAALAASTALSLWQLSRTTSLRSRLAARLGRRADRRG